jgi:hypothetical protein
MKGTAIATAAVERTLMIATTLAIANMIKTVSDTIEPVTRDVSP